MERRMFMRVRMYQRVTDSRSLLDDVRNVGRRRRDEKRGCGVVGGVCGQVSENGCKGGWVWVATDASVCGDAKGERPRWYNGRRGGGRQGVDLATWTSKT